jgi:DNA-binding CsgD family transcriptional regulator
MSQSVRPTHQQVLDVMRLMADVAALKGDPPQQRQVLIDGLSRIVGTNQGLFFVGDGWKPGAEARVAHMTVGTHHDQLFMHYLGEVGARMPLTADAFLDHSIGDPSPHQTWSFQRVLAGQDAQRKYDTFAAVKDAGRVREGIVTVARVGEDRIVSLAMHQFGGARTPTDRQRALAMFATQEIERLVVKGHLPLPPVPSAGLPPRLTQVLDRLLSGRAPKQIARELGLSIWTVREHVQRIYRYYSVSGREELTARFIKGGADKGPSLK